MKSAVLMVLACSVAAGLFAADLKVFISSNDTAADVLRKTVAAGKVKCVTLVTKASEENGELAVRTQQINASLTGRSQNTYTATLTTPTGELIWTDHSTSGLGLLAKHLSSFGCKRSTQ